MSPDAIYGVLFIVSIVLYLIAPIWLVSKGYPLIAGLVMLGLALIPLISQVELLDSDSPGPGLLLIFTLPLPLMLILFGLGSGCVRLVRRFVPRYVPPSIQERNI